MQAAPAPLQLEPSSWDAFVDLLLYHMYHDQLPEGVSAAQVLEAARLADRFQVRCSCVLFCLAREGTSDRLLHGFARHTVSSLTGSLAARLSAEPRELAAPKTSSARCT